MIKQLHDTHLPPPPPSDEMAAIPPPDAEFRGKKLTLIYHDESIFSTNEGQPKTKGIMISDYVDQHSGFLQLTPAEAELAKANGPSFPTTARVFLEYGANKEGYWTSERFLANVKDAIKIAKYKYPPDKYTVLLYSTTVAVTGPMLQML